MHERSGRASVCTSDQDSFWKQTQRPATVVDVRTKLICLIPILDLEIGAVTIGTDGRKRFRTDQTTETLFYLLLGIDIICSQILSEHTGRTWR
jgi:hypothetical protein